jgi:hypothetical protein
MSRLALACTLLVGAAAVAAEDPAIAAARARQEAATTLVLEYRQVTRVFLPATAARPATEAVAAADNRIVLDGPRVRVEDNNPTMSTGGSFLRQQRISVFDGKESRTLFPGGICPGEPPTGIIHVRDERGNAPLPEPVALHFRGLKSEFGFHTIDRWQSTGRATAIDGVSCPEFEVRLKEQLTRYWVDPTKGHVVRRVEFERDGRLTRRGTSTYRQNPAGWVPTGWREEVLRADGTPQRIHESTVTRLVVNGPADAAEFRLEFPPGANVNDQQMHRELRVEPDGRLRELTPEEMFGTPPRTTARQWVGRNTWWIILLAVALAAALVGILIWKRTRRTAAPWERVLE